MIFGYVNHTVCYNGSFKLVQKGVNISIVNNINQIQIMYIIFYLRLPPPTPPPTHPLIPLPLLAIDNFYFNYVSIFFNVLMLSAVGFQ